MIFHHKTGVIKAGEDIIVSAHRRTFLGSQRSYRADKDRGSNLEEGIHGKRRIGVTTKNKIESKPESKEKNRAYRKKKFRSLGCGKLKKKTKLVELKETEYGNSKNPNRNKNRYQPSKEKSAEGHDRKSPS